MEISEKIKAFVDTMLAGKSAEEQVTILRNCFEDHALQHPWADTDLVDSVLENVAREYKVPYEAGELEDEEEYEDYASSALADAHADDEVES